MSDVKSASHQRKQGYTLHFVTLSGRNLVSFRLPYVLFLSRNALLHHTSEQQIYRHTLQAHLLTSAIFPISVVPFPEK